MFWRSATLHLCKVCGYEKPISKFSGTRKVCNPCYNARIRERYRTDPDYRGRRRLLNKRSVLRKRGFTLEEVQERLRMGGGCDICKGNLSKGYHTDHDHRTGKPRGILCVNCNFALGQLNDSPARAVALAHYLYHWKYEHKKDLQRTSVAADAGQPALLL